MAQQQVLTGIEGRIRKPSANITRPATLIYGRGGVGKTSLLATMSNKGLVIDVPQVEGGTMVLAEQADRIDVLPVARWDDLDEVMRYLKKTDTHGYKWVSWDGLTAIQVLAKRKAIRERELSADPHMMDQRDWGKIGNLMAEFIYQCRLVPLQMVFTAQERSVTTGGSTEMIPDVSPASLSAIWPSMFLVGRLYVQDVTDETGATVWERRLRVGPHYQFMTKTRTLPSRPLPAVLRNPNLTGIYAYILGVSKEVPEGINEESVFSVA